MEYDRLEGQEGNELPIGDKEIAEAFERLRKYKDGKSSLEKRVVNAPLGAFRQ